ncbi:MAG: flagellar hook-basal body complex protein FliE [Proteobacteria bacterium]|nr:flagellar hook-basal body complex protein FliE [Pseudomonadota bacterium]
MTIAPIETVSALAASAAKTSIASPSSSADFAGLLRQGIQQTSDRLDAADRQLAAFALDDTVPLHQVTFAIEQARLSLELMLQVRNQVMQAYQQMMSMQL